MGFFLRYVDLKIVSILFEIILLFGRLVDREIEKYCFFYIIGKV